jgi:hypothetical protein
MSIEKYGFICDNLSFLKSKITRITKALSLLRKSNVYYNFELNIFLEDLDKLVDVIKKQGQNLEKGLEKRKEFLIKNNLEDKYQEFKKNNK